MSNKIFGSISRACILLSLFVLAPACQRVGPAGGGEEAMPVTRVDMNVSIDRWDATGTKGTEETFPEWARIVVLISNGKGDRKTLEVHQYGGEWFVEEAIWRGDGWNLYGDVDMSAFSSGRCICYYFESSDMSDGDCFWRSDNNQYAFDDNTAIYRDDDGLFGITDGVLGFNIRLTPVTGRIRIASPGPDKYGNNWYSCGIYGLKLFDRLDMERFELVGHAGYIHRHIDEGGDWSEYAYGVFADPERRTLTIADEKYNTYYERSFQEDIFAPGKSNWTYQPTEESHNEWYRYDGTLNSYSMEMQYVVPGTFEMGGEDAGPVHTVTLTRGYYLGRTEVTRDMWYSVMGEPSNYANSEVPVTGMTWEEIEDFIATLNAKTGYNYRLPTEAEWEYAARGGLRSNGYKYSGSDTYQEVAVQDWNWSMTMVRSKNPNELNFYDMSGNASEWCSDWYGDYPEGPVVDPKGPETGEIHVRRGGNRGEDTRFLTVTYRDVESNTSLAGFRLALDAPKIQ